MTQDDLDHHDQCGHEKSGHPCHSGWCKIFGGGVKILGLREFFDYDWCKKKFWWCESSQNLFFFFFSRAMIFDFTYPGMISEKSHDLFFAFSFVKIKKSFSELS